MSIQFSTRQAVRQALAAKLNEGLILDVDGVEIVDGLTRIRADGLFNINSLQGSSIVYEGHTRRVRQHNDTEGYIDVGLISGAAAGGILEVWSEPYNPRTINSLIDGVLKEAIARDYVVEDYHGAWVLSQFSDRFGLPQQTHRLSNVRGSGRGMMNIQAIRREYQIVLGEGVEKVASGSLDNMTFGGSNIGSNGLLARVPVTYTMAMEPYDTILLGITTNREVRLNITDGVTEKVVKMYANVPRVIDFQSPAAISSISALEIRNGGDDDISLQFTLSGGYYYAKSSVKNDTEPLSLNEWTVDRLTRQVTHRTAAMGASWVEMKAYRFPVPISSDDDLVELPTDTVVDIIGAQLVQDAQPNPQTDISGKIQRVPIKTRDQDRAYRTLPIPASSRYVGSRSRLIVEDIVTIQGDIVLSVGFIDDIINPHPGPASVTLSPPGPLPRTVTADLPDEPRYLSIEWSASASVDTIIIDGFDQTSSFTITGNRAVSTTRVELSDDDKQVIVRVE